MAAETQIYTRQLSYRKDDRAIRPIYRDLKTFESP